MPYSIVKEEYYRIMGMQPKTSAYDTPSGKGERVVNLDYTRTGALTQVPGTTIYLGATVAGRITGLEQFGRLSGQSYLIASANTNIYSVTSAFNPIRSGLKDGALFDFVPFVDRLFCANGEDFFKTDGVNSSKFSLPPGATGFVAVADSASSFTGFFQYAYGYLNERGFAGPISPPVGISVSGTNVALSGFTLPLDYGITAIIIYRSENNVSAVLSPIQSIDPSSATFIDTGFSLGGSVQPPYSWFTLSPRYIELFNNQLFMAGFSSLLSSVFFSDIGEPEGIGATATFEVRTNDGDRVTGMRSYSSQLAISKLRSFHTLSGDNPQNFTLQERSDQYGCVSNRAMAVFNDRMLFLDSKGVCQFNGANIGIISNDMEPVFLRMNVAAAQDEAMMIHVKPRNEIWTVFPIDGATMNNQMVVYDYYANEWYERVGINVSSINQVTFNEPYPTPFYGGYTGNIFNFGASLPGDNGMGITLLFRSRWHNGGGDSTEKQFRRLWLDVVPNSPSQGGTTVVNVNFYANHNEITPALTRQMFGATWQTRIDFGIPAKSLLVEFSFFSTTQQLQINGYALGQRFQRDV